MKVRKIVSKNSCLGILSIFSIGFITLPVNANTIDVAQGCPAITSNGREIKIRGGEYRIYGIDRDLGNNRYVKTSFNNSIIYIPEFCLTAKSKRFLPLTASERQETELTRGDRIH